ncbi:MAG: hypothetical protein D6736_01960 [Nitrospinota bacterium]|nr:MAG: hypothetical protein D6736_01960 [Nitrospinota bacterium]
MPTLAQVLTTILSRQRIRLVDLAPQAGITASYISNLKRGGRVRPSQGALQGLVRALQRFHVPTADLQQLVEAAGYSWEPFQATMPIDEPPPEETLSLLDALMHEFTARSLVTSPPSSFPGVTGPEPDILLEGDRATLFQVATRLLKQAARRKRRKKSPQKIYLTWWHTPSSQQTEHPPLQEAEEEFTTTLRQLLWPHTPWQVLQLWTGPERATGTIVVEALRRYFGTTNYWLYTLPHHNHLPALLLIEGWGGLIGFPKLDRRYAILQVGPEARQEAKWPALSALISYVEYLLGPEETRQPLIQTSTVPEFSLDTFESIVAAEEKVPTGERLVIRPTFSTVYRPLSVLQERLQKAIKNGETQQRHLALQKRRLTALEHRLKRGRERVIHVKDALRSLFAELATELSTAPSVRTTMYKEQILRVLEIMTGTNAFHWGLVDQPLSLAFGMVGDTADFLAFYDSDRTETPSLKPLEDLSDLEGPVAIARTHHPLLLRRLRQEFNTWWQTIPPQWRTDTEAGKEFVPHWIITESLHALLRAKVPPPILWSFAQELVQVAAQPVETFQAQVVAHEQGARQIFLLTATLPWTMIPVEVGPWPRTSLLRTRQAILPFILSRVERWDWLVSAEGIRRYWSGESPEIPLQPEERAAHVRHIQGLLRAADSPLEITLLPHDPFAIYWEVIDQEYVVLEQGDTWPGKGIILHDPALAQAIVEYIQEMLAQDPACIRGTSAVSRWLTKTCSA